MEWCHIHKIRSQTDYIMMARFNHETSNLVNWLFADECEEVIKQISLGKYRMFFGTDFPITHYYEQINNGKKSTDRKSLTLNYRRVFL